MVTQADAVVDEKPAAGEQIEVCISCRHYVADRDDTGEKTLTGTCHRYPPWQIRERKWPPVWNSDGCGEWHW